MDNIRDEMKDLKRQVEEEAAEVRTYVVKSGDSLSTIAEELLGDAGRWHEIFEANEDEIDDPNQIKAGQELRIPS